MVLPAPLLGIGGSLLASAFAVLIGGVGCGGSMAPASDEAGQGGSSMAAGGATATMGQGGARAAGGSTDAIDCSNTVCPSLPANCIEFIQPAGDCCAQCVAGNACPPCPPPLCAAGSHAETLAGDCCPQCVVNAPAACEEGQASYAAMRLQLIDKFSTITCQNSAECTIVTEINACVWNCGNPSVSRMADSLKSALNAAATNWCSGCAPPLPVMCELMVPACVNGKCVAASPI